MAYVLIRDNAVAAYPYPIQQLRDDNPSVSFPVEPTAQQLAEFGVYQIMLTPAPAFDETTHSLYEANPTLVDGAWTQVWDVRSVDQATMASRLAEKRAAMVVTPFQAKAALQMAGLLSQVDAIMADPATDVLAKLAWNEALEFRRTSPTLLGLAQMLGMSEADLDNLFAVAATIVA